MSATPKREPENCAGCKFLEFHNKSDVWGCYHPDIMTKGSAGNRIGWARRIAYELRCQGDWFVERVTNGPAPT